MNIHLQITLTFLHFYNSTFKISKKNSFYNYNDTHFIANSLQFKKLSSDY